MRIRIAENIDDPFLRSEWERLEQEGDVFPQNTYHWCSTWWKYLRGKRKLHIVMALDDEGKALGIAPLCIERHFGVRILRSFPIHFGDFYTFITANNKDSKRAIGRIVEYMNSDTQWRWSRLEQVSESSTIYDVLRSRQYFPKKMTGCILLDFEGINWEQFVTRLKASSRKNVRRRLRKMNRECEVEFECLKDQERFDRLFQEMIDMYTDRLKYLKPVRSEKEIMAFQEAIDYSYKKKNSISFCLFLNGTLAAYCVGFLHGKTYYNWRSSANRGLLRYHSAVMIYAYVIQWLIEQGFHKMNFMAGEYDWKLDWSPDRRTENNYMFSSPSNDLVSGFLNWYHHRVRDRLKETYHWMMGFRILRVVSKNAILLKQKLGGIRRDIEES